MLTIGTRVQHKLMPEYVGKITRIYPVTKQQAKENGAGSASFVMYAVKWDKLYNGVPITVHIDAIRGYRETDLITM